jgi:hypothetical protein
MKNLTVKDAKSAKGRGFTTTSRRTRRKNYSFKFVVSVVPLWSSFLFDLYFLGALGVLGGSTEVF